MDVTCPKCGTAVEKYSINKKRRRIVGKCPNTACGKWGTLGKWNGEENEGAAGKEKPRTQAAERKQAPASTNRDGKRTGKAKRAARPIRKPAGRQPREPKPYEPAADARSFWGRIRDSAAGFLNSEF